MPLGKPLLDALERMSCGGVVLDAAGTVLRINHSAERILKQLSSGGESTRFSKEQVQIRRTVRGLLAGPPHFALHGAPWTSVERMGKRQLLVHQIELEEETAAGPDRVIILVDLDASPVLNSTTLQKVFGLTAAEASLAADIATGNSLAKITETKGISMTTCKTQLAAIFAKTRTRRQAELVALLTRISILP